MKRDIDYKLVVAATFVSLVAAVSILNYNAFHNTQKELISIAYRSVKATGVTLRLIANHPDVTPEQLQELLDQLTGQGFDYVAVVINGDIRYWSSRYDGFLPVNPELKDSMRVIKTPLHRILEFQVPLNDSTEFFGGYSLEFVDIVGKRARKNFFMVIAILSLLAGVSMMVLYNVHGRIIRKEIELESEKQKVKHYMELSGLSSAVAHEIKNPLSTIYLAIQVLRSDSNCNPRYIQIIEQEIERLNRIVNEFRSVSRPIEPRIVECNLRELVRKVIESIKGNSDFAAKVDFHVDIPEGLTVKCDPHHMEQVIFNLVKNAVEAVEKVENPRITIRAHKRGNSIEISISDNGTGMEKDVVEHIFDYFYTTKSNGLGIGLPIVKKIVEAHGGRISVSSTPGKGTTFVIKLTEGRHGG